jgi:tetratricopeptide (TPR) repeat protein
VPPQTPPTAPLPAAPLEGDITLRAAPAEAAPAAEPANPLLLEGTAPGGGFLDEVERERRVFVGMLEREITNAVIAARERMRTEPQAVIQELKLALENVRRAPDIDAGKRAELEDKLQIALREAMRQSEIKDELDRLRDEEVAAAREQRYLEDQLARRIERESQLMSRFNALMDEKHYVEAEEVAEIVEEIDPNGVTPRAAVLYSRHKRHYYLQQVARSARHAAAWDTMYQIELSHIPFPDNPPIVYPDAPVWEELTKRRKDRYAAADLKSESEAERRIYGALRQPLRAPLDFTDTPLNQVTAVISEEYDIPIVFDTTALDAIASSPEVEVSININNVSLRSALELMLKSVEDLTYIVDNEVLLITTVEKANENLQVKVYPVADLVLPIQDIGSMGGGMMGGGMMGGGMGGGMGGMGGGMGGMGGGMGGMGGGGGGFFAVPDAVKDVAPKAPPAENATPARPATISLTAAEAPAATPAAAPAEAKPPRVSGIEIDASVAPEAFWKKYFAEKQQDAETVRRAVRNLMKQKHYDHAIALIQAALAAGQPQPWMYESLGIALELAGRPKAEIERAIMSACDFSTNPEELMLIARYLSHIGLDARAVSVYRQVIKAAPLYQDAFALGLRAAQRAKDTAGIRWAAVGILKQAWPTDQQAIRNTAVRVAQATLEEMRAAGDAKGAEAFQQELDAALVRDCIVKVTWSGDADVDLVVEEPGGTTCSVREPRTASGGVCLGDSYASEGAGSSEGFSETYVCPEGFAGEYRVRVRKVWGDLVADRVTVDVYKNFRSANEKHQRQHIPVGDDDALVKFTLDEGRRADPVEAQQLLATIKRQDLIQQAALAQQLGSLADLGAAPTRGNLDPLDLRRQLALARGGAVGFMPIIQTLPEGTQLFATAVVSADRRYVRITAFPSFTGIGNVTTFTFAGAGQQLDQDQDQGNDQGNDQGADQGADQGDGGVDFGN